MAKFEAEVHEEDWAAELGCIPIDSHALDFIQHMSMDLNRFFDDIDDDGLLIKKKKVTERKGKDFKTVLEAMKKTDPEGARIMAANKAACRYDDDDNTSNRVSAEVFKKTEAAKGSKKSILVECQEKVVEEKLENSKRSLQKAYDVIKNEKKKRKIQVVGFQEAAPPIKPNPKKSSKLSIRQRIDKKIKSSNVHHKFRPLTSCT